MDYENFDTSLIVLIEDGKYAFSGGVLEAKPNADVKFGWAGILPLREEAHGKYQRGEKVPDDAILSEAPPFGFAFQDQERVDDLIRYLGMVKSCMAEAGIPYSKDTEEEPHE